LKLKRETRDASFARITNELSQTEIERSIIANNPTEQDTYLLNFLIVKTKQWLYYQIQLISDTANQTL
jgi:hypothetical protein